MKENLTGRVGRIISGSVNALISAVENAAPQMVLEEAVREIDGAIDDVRAELGRVTASKHLANNRMMEENQRHEELAEQIANAISADRDDLAEAGIAQQMDIEVQMPVLERAIADAAEKEKELEGYIQALQAKRREMRDAIKQMAESAQEAQATAGEAGVATQSDVAARVAKAESAFDRVMEKQTGLAAGRGTPNAETAAKLAELEELSRSNRIKERLAAIKADAEKG